MKKYFFLSVLPALVLSHTAAQADPSSVDSLISRHAAAHGVPEALVHRIIKRESNYNAGAVGRGGALGLMQIKYATARGVGYAGSPSGLLDADTNLAYGVRYLAGAYRVASGNQDRALGYYASGYYYAAKRRGLTAVAKQETPVRYATANETTGSVAAPAPVTRPDWADMR
jgi:soluble lytic murein transglycosylase-like protein